MPENFDSYTVTVATSVDLYNASEVTNVDGGLSVSAVSSVDGFNVPQIDYS